MRHGLACAVLGGGLCFPTVPAALAGAIAGPAAPAIGHEIPPDITTPGGAPAASLAEASRFAWEEFIAMNWPGAAGKRGVADSAARLDAADRPRVWETWRNRVEAYPGIGSPTGGDGAGAAYGFDREPRYIYDPDKVHTPSGQTPGTTIACADSVANSAVPWHNLDEPDHGDTQSGLSPETPYPAQQVLLESKVNREHYVYIASRGWYGDAPMRIAKRRTGELIRQTGTAPPAAAADAPDDHQLISFPNGAMELKAAWRRLGSLDDPAHFITGRVRYYERMPDGNICHHDSKGGAGDTWGLVAMHVMHKTPSAPYFIWATFEQVDTMVANHPDARGRPVPVDLPDGAPNPVLPTAPQAYTPSITITPATADEDQQISFGQEKAEKGLALFFNQEPIAGLPSIGRVVIHRRLNRLPDAVIAANDAAQSELQKAYPNLPLAHYRLSSLQFKLTDKVAGKRYDGPDPDIYYASNPVIEPSPVQQEFSGQFTSVFAKASDYLHPTMKFLNPPPNPREPVFLNAFFGGHGVLAGGCLGCHGFRQVYGTDWSFLLERQRVTTPEVKE